MVFTPTADGRQEATLVDALLQDLRYAVRGLVRRPGFTLVAVLTLALGIGANTSIFSVVHGVLLSPLAFPHADRVVALHAPDDAEADISEPDAVDLRAGVASLSAIGIYNTWAFDLTGRGEPERLNGAIADAAYFTALGMAPLVGRVYTEADGDARVAVISEGLWRRRFQADPGVLGTTFTLSDHPYTIIGVMPAAFDFLQQGLTVWTPIAGEAPWAASSRGSNNFEAVARLADGATLAQARAELQAVTARLAQVYPATNQSKFLTATPLREYLTGDVRPALFALLGAVGLVLLIGCANLSNLLLARAAMRRQELAVRVAVGAGRARLTRQLLSESLVLALIGGAAGLLLAVWGRAALLAVMPATLPRADTIRLNGAVLGFSVLLTVGTGLLFGVLPARWAVNRAPAEALVGAGRATAGGGPRRLLDGLVTAEMALAFLLLVGAGLLLRTFGNLRRVDLGFNPDSLLVASIVLPEARYGAIDPQTAAFRGIVERVGAIPGVVHAASVISPPLEGGGIGHAFQIEGRPEAKPGERPGTRIRPVTGDYFATVDLPVMQGRALTPADREATLPVAVINETFARRFFADEDPIGHRLTWVGSGPTHWMTIVGVARDVKMNNSLAGSDPPTVYMPYPQRTESWQRFGSLVVRTRVPPRSIERQVKEAVWAVDPTLTIADFATMQERRAGAMAQQRFNALAIGAFAFAALLMAVQGIYGVLAWTVEQRRHEIGIRMALGARRDRVVAMVLRHGLGRVAIGLAAGIAGALALSRLVAGLLFGVRATDPLAFTAAAAALLAVAALASWLPARRAARTDPMTALRSE